jgi:hypothetical protein
VDRWVLDHKEHNLIPVENTKQAQTFYSRLILQNEVQIFNCCLKYDDYLSYNSSSMFASWPGQQWLSSDQIVKFISVQ